MATKESATDKAAEQAAPTVFISYSHDTRDHKSWVAALANRLMNAGVNVLFDQWDLGPGDDVAKFMEQAVRAADRVLMICTEEYVRKADDGKGGVGYETMVVTGEIVNDLGTNKFIPIVRQTNAPKSLPRCVATRFFVDLSEGANIDENFESLLREILNVPKVAKPSLGRNPFQLGTFESQEKRQNVESQLMEFAEALSRPEDAYKSALYIAQSDNRVAWRKLLLAANERSWQSLMRWRTENPNIPHVSNTNPNNPEWQPRLADVQTGVQLFAPLIACLVAAAETGKNGYADQLSWIDFILKPVGYDVYSVGYHGRFPPTVFFIAQALFGGMLMLSGSGESAYRLATTKVADQENSQDARPLFETPKFNGWPDTLEHDCRFGWQLLGSVVDSSPWIKLAFGNENECLAGISAYYQILSLLNCIKLIVNGTIEQEQQWGTAFQITVPQSYCALSRNLDQRAYGIFLSQTPLIKGILESKGVGQDKFKNAWPHWIAKIRQWVADVHGRGVSPAQRDLPDRLNEVMSKGREEFKF